MILIYLGCFTFIGVFKRKYNQIYKKNIWVILNALEYNDNVPKIIEKTPKYWVLDNSSSKKINENRELNKGVKERRGIVRLRSDSLIDLRNNNAENIPKIIKTVPGIKYEEIFT